MERLLNSNIYESLDVNLKNFYRVQPAFRSVQVKIYRNRRFLLYMVLTIEDLPNTYSQ